MSTELKVDCESLTRGTDAYTIALFVTVKELQKLQKFPSVPLREETVNPMFLT